MKMQVQKMEFLVKYNKFPSCNELITVSILITHAVQESGPRTHTVPVYKAFLWNAFSSLPFHKVAVTFNDGQEATLLSILVYDLQKPKFDGITSNQPIGWLITTWQSLHELVKGAWLSNQLMHANPKGGLARVYSIILGQVRHDDKQCYKMPGGFCHVAFLQWSLREISPDNDYCGRISWAVCVRLLGHGMMGKHQGVSPWDMNTYMNTYNSQQNPNHIFGNKKLKTASKAIYPFEDVITSSKRIP